MSLAAEITKAEALQTIIRWENNQHRIRLRESGGATDAAMAIAKTHIGEVVAAIRRHP
jgi:hypothetical protein